jgi:shikimate kinase
MLLSLVGMPGGGKSTVGRHLARRLGVDFVDSDAVVERRAGESIRSYFEREGEERFRDLESSFSRSCCNPSRVSSQPGAAWWCERSIGTR